MSTRIRLTQIAIISLVLLVLAFAPLARATSIESLPDYTRNQDTVRSDWLVKPIEVKSDVFRTDNVHNLKGTFLTRL